ncbi:D-allulose-6-phosphate 3-epimerase [Anaerobiospirillum thomasii]|uniref:D-allulose 6-phosphate 3-epimerase n=1 Tax=Anaerobiospirillum thomasii TaxID=179995 RepID=UPI000D91CC8A|nr:D-allulose 6-phosphate 3-epimerase [Anaerobiospirillum thomasii]SPT71646.1 D-allulose-6-phosphate 3-epimerase [Anaerobiospirillum thomasii]
MSSEFSVSLMCMDYLHIEEQILALNDETDYYHADLMDGHFCKNITMSPDLIAAITKVSKKPMDVHLMTVHPNDWIEPLAKAGVTTICPHAETINTDAFRTINRIRDFGCQAGIVLNPATPIDVIKHYINRLSMVTIMTVDVGFAGQPFIPEMLDKIKALVKMREELNLNFKIQIDGSCNNKTFKQLHEAGADIFILGSSGLFNRDKNIHTAFEQLRHDFKELTGQEV